MERQPWRLELYSRTLNRACGMKKLERGVIIDAWKMLPKNEQERHPPGYIAWRSRIIHVQSCHNPDFVDPRVYNPGV